jgi:AcrR family transcriptional regulator
MEARQETRQETRQDRSKGSRRRRAVTRDELLAVARDHTVRYGWKRTRVQDVAADAGVSRPTLYKEFPSKRELGAALIQWEVTKFIAELVQSVESEPPGLRNRLVAGIRFALSESENDPFLTALLTVDRDEESLLPEITQGRSVLPRIIAAAVALFEAQAGDVDRGRLEFVAGVAVRLTTSLLVDPAPEPHDVTANRIADMCVAYLSGP